MPRLPPTPSATVGPFFAMKLEEVREIAPWGARGRRIRIVGRVLDGEGQGVEDALVEIWQADDQGRYRHPADPRGTSSQDDPFLGYGRVHSERTTGDYAFTTVLPGPVPDPEGGVQAPHLNLMVTARGLLRHLHTRVYFGDQTAANDADFVLRQVPAERRSTLVAVPADDGVYRFDLRLQGAAETVFFELGKR